jgi:hypothetical protein
MLSNYITSSYIRAANRLAGKHAREKIVVYVESFDDVFFWSNLLRSLETERFYFEVMLPSKTTLCKGKKIALSNRLGPNMIACVDADYDYLMQGATPTSYEVCNNPFVFHTIVYAIENYHCYAESIQNACVMATLNDRRLFDFPAFMKAYSETIWPLFLWSVWAYRYGQFKQFSMVDFYRIVRIRDINLYHPEVELQALRKRVNSKVNRLQHQFPQGKSTFKPLKEQLLELGVTPETTYLFMRGHDLHDGVVIPVAEKVCELLRKEREREIRKLAEHNKQMQNELASYQHSIAPITETIKRHNGYYDSPHYQFIQKSISQFLEQYDNLDLTQQTKEPVDYEKTHPNDTDAPLASRGNEPIERRSEEYDSFSI